MFRFLSRRRFLRLSIAGVLGAGSGGCGTILYPERIGQPPGPLDWKVVALDTIGLLLFLVPGVIAFVVDFYNGTIYLPQGYYGSTGPVRGERKFTTVQIPRRELTRTRIEQAVAEHTGHPVELAEGRYETRELSNLDEFWTVHDELARSAS